MGKKVKIELNNAGIVEMLRSENVQAACQSRVEQAVGMASANPENFEVDTRAGKIRSHTMVKVKNNDGLKEVYENNTLEKVLGYFDRSGK